MKKNLLYTFTLFLMSSAVLSSCSPEKKDKLSPYPEDITFEEQAVDRFSYSIPNAPFKAGDAKTGIITVNVKKGVDGAYSGFAVSNKNWRSYPWSLSPDFASPGLTPAQKQAALDSCIYSVYTNRPNHTGTYLVGYAKDDDAAITLEKPAVVEHVLVANTTYNTLLETYGSTYSGTLDAATQKYSATGTKVKNIMIANPATAMYGRFTLPGPNNTEVIRLMGTEILAKVAAGRAAAQAARDNGKPDAEAAADSLTAYNALANGYVKLTVKGFAGNNPTGSVDFWMAVRPNVDPANPAYNFVISDWFKMDLTTLGTVDKLVFHISSSYNDGAGNSRYPPYFCLDGMRIRKQ